MPMLYTECIPVRSAFVAGICWLPLWPGRAFVRAAKSLSICLMVVGIATSAVADWPEFRGPSRQGVVADRELPVEWGPGESIAWRSELPGEGWSSPVVVDRSIYLTAAIPASTGSGDGAGYRLVLMTLDAGTGDLVQTTPLFRQPPSAPKIHQKNSHASPTPVYDGSHLYVHFGHQGIACVNLQGDVLWRNDSLGYPPVHGNGGSPAVVGDLLVFSRDGGDVAEVVALDKRTGELAWRTARDVDVERTFSFCTPLRIAPDMTPPPADPASANPDAAKLEREQIIVPGSNVAQSFDPQTGKELWRVEYDGYSVIPRPIYHAGLVYVCTGYNRPSLLAIDPTGSGDVTDTHVRWRTDSNVPHTSSLIAYRNSIVMVSDRGIASGLEAETGNELWRERIGGNFSASPLLAGDRVYLLSESGDCTVLDLSQGQPEELAVNRMGERTLASLAVVDSDLLLRTADALYRISTSK